MRGAKLDGVNLYGANLRWAKLEGADLEEAKLDPEFIESRQIVPKEGSFRAWKKTTKGVIRIEIPADAERVSALKSRKCRASKIKVIFGKGCGGTGPQYGSLTYDRGEVVEADSFNGDAREECTNGIHFFMTKKEAEEW